MRRSIRALPLALVATSLLTASALGHAELRSAQPGPDDVIREVPAELVARFTQDLHGDRTSIEVRDAAGTTIARGGADAERPRVQRVALPPLEPGRYEVRWVTFSAQDDEIARGRYGFTVRAAPATPQPMASPSPSPLPATSPGPCPSPLPDVSPGHSPDALAGPTAAVSPGPGASPVTSPDACPSASPAWPQLPVDDLTLRLEAEASARAEGAPEASPPS